jgi:hypothetical protein
MKNFRPAIGAASVAVARRVMPREELNKYPVYTETLST